MEDEKNEKNEKIIKHYADDGKEQYNIYIKRFDYLYFVINTAGIYVCLESLKYFKEKYSEINLLILKISAILFLISIFSDLVKSVFLASHNKDISDHYNHILMFRKENKELEESMKSKKTLYVAVFSFLLQALTNFIAISLLVYYFFVNI